LSSKQFIVRFFDLRSKPNAHYMYVQDQVIIHTARM
jgi:hypothetical protein